jgi:Zn-dependent M28 family amino/carboxypeptidase
VADWLGRLPDGTPVEIAADEGRGEDAATWNVVGALRGTGTRAGEAVVLSAHIDHLGTNPALDGDQVFNGADDDASGVAAVLELARILRAGGPGGRTVVFAFFGSEEAGGLGAARFVERPPVPLASIVANLEFEMIGRPDPAVKAGTAWLTGYERSDLGDALRARGAPLGPDPHPEEGFFQRSDNYQLALRGVVAHTVASFGLHRDYHGVDDEVDRLDFAHFRQVVEGMVRPVRSLLDGHFTPAWKGAPPGR